MTTLLAETSVLSSTGGGLVLLLVLYQVTKVIYNIYFHPLSKFPGPSLLATSPIVWWWSLFRGREADSELALHQKYGPVVRVGPDSLSFTSAQAWKDITGFSTGKSQLKKDQTLFGEKKRGYWSIISTPDDKDHGRQRRTLAHAFSDSALREQEPLIKPYFDLLIHELQKQIDGPAKGRVEMTRWYNFTTFDIIGDLALGESFHALEGGEYHPWVATIFKSIKMGVFIRLGLIYPWISVILNAIFKHVGPVRRMKEGHDDHTDEKVDSRLAISTDRKDFLTYLLGSRDTMPDGELKNNMGTLILAGSETTATLLSGLTYFILTNPRVYNKLVNEIRTHFRTEEEICFLTTAQLPYLFAVIEESLRLYPPVPTRVPRVTGPEGNIVDGHFIPPGTSVAVMQYAAGRSKLNWHNPMKFFPERFTEDAPPEYKADCKAALQPFSTGPRNCIGKNLAYNEMKTILARVLWNFDMHLLPESQHWMDHRVYLLWEKPALWIRLSKREGL